jgi:alkylation response protein AidB-like acyl-CoA dehydrogenase
VDDGFMVSGRWTYLSGIGHATGAGLAAHMIDPGSGERRLRPDGTPEVVRVVVPRSDYQVVPGSWDVVGLLGTMSGDVELSDVFVPTAHAYRTEDPRQLSPPRTFAGAGLAGGPGLAFVALGRVERAFDEFLALAPARGKREFVLEEAARTLADRPVVHARTAVVLARILAIREWLYAVVERQQRAVAGEVPLDRDAEAMHMQLARVHAAQEARDCAQVLCDLGGTATIRTGNAIERALRDLLTLCAHIFLAEPQYEVVGRWIAGRGAGSLSDAGRLIP